MDRNGEDVSKERRPRERALAFVRWVVPEWRPTATQVVWTIRGIIVLSILFLIGCQYDITLWDWLKILVFPAAVAIGTFGLNQAAKDREQARESANATNEYRKDLLFRLTRIYKDTKKIRRILKAHIVTKRDGSNEKEISCTVYEEQLEKLLDPQLEVELYRPDRIEGANVFLLPFENAEEIAKYLEETEKYLNSVTHEYDGGSYQQQKQELFPAGINSSSRIPLNKLPELQTFIRAKTFARGYASTIKKIQKTMQAEIEDTVKRAFD